MKKSLLGLTAAIVLILAWFAWGGGIVSQLERTMGTDLPRGVQVEYTDTHGGFHGDGEMKATVTFANEKAGEAFLGKVSAQWEALPAWMLGSIRGEWPELPAVENGYWMYRDRYFEQYGERCSHNAVLQNCTFALMDADTLTLYVFECDF